VYSFDKCTLGAFIADRMQLSLVLSQSHRHTAEIKGGLFHRECGAGTALSAALIWSLKNCIALLTRNHIGIAAQVGTSSILAIT
jgi:hypothetical protein